MWAHLEVLVIFNLLYTIFLSVVRRCRGNWPGAAFKCCGEYCNYNELHLKDVLFRLIKSIL